MNMLDHESDASSYSSINSSDASPAPLRERANVRTRSRVGIGMNTKSSTRSKRQKTEIITIDDSDNDFVLSSSEESDESSEEEEGLMKRLQKRMPVTAKHKTTGLSSDDDHVDMEDDSSDEEDEDGPILKGRRRRVSPTGSVSSQTMFTDNPSSRASKSNNNSSARTNPRKPPSARPSSTLPPPTTKDTKSYLTLLKKNENKRRFPLSQIPKHQVISTGRTIKPLKAWRGFWPPLREFLQNTVDHLSLMDGKTGRRRGCLDVAVETAQDDDASTIRFSCGDKDICKFIVSQDEVIIEQRYTYPIASRSLDTGVVDTSKTSDTNQAGGFGDGFKTAAVALIANSKKGRSTDFECLEWYFYALQEKTKVKWSFEGLTKEKIATFAKCEVLQVVIDKSPMTRDEIALFEVGDDDSQYVMRQVVKVKKIGKAFLEDAIPKFSVFWDLDEESLISTLGRNSRGLGGDFIGPSSMQPNLFGGSLGRITPKAGTYVRGIWIRSSKIKDTIMSFFGNRLEVSGRDRNEVDDDELLKAFVYVLHRCNDMEYLRQLLTPLRQPSSGGKKSGDASWLLASPAFFNRVIEDQRIFILHDVLQIPAGSIFISDKTLKSKDPFMAWASAFMKNNGTPLVSIEKGSNKYLFQEVDEYEMTERCVQIIKAKMKGKGKAKGNSQSIFNKFLAFLGIRRAKVIFSEDVGVAFAHDASIYIPASSLTRELIIRVLNVSHSCVEGVVPEHYSSLLEAVLTCMNSGKGSTCTLQDAEKIVKKAQKIKSDAANFFHNAGAVESDAGVDLTSDGRRSKTQGNTRDGNMVEEAIDLTSDEPISTTHSSDRDGNGACEDRDLAPEGFNQLEQMIQKMPGNAENGDEDVAGATFDADNAGCDHHIRPSSDMTSVKVDDSLGGGHILCDEATASSIRRNTFEKKNRTKVLSLRRALNEACDIIRRSIPSVRPLLENVHVGYDGKNDGYEGFFNGNRIVVNLYAFLPKINGATVPRKLIHDFVTVVTHELAHAILPEAGHGPDWRNCHMLMIIEVMKRLENL